MTVRGCRVDPGSRFNRLTRFGHRPQSQAVDAPRRRALRCAGRDRGSASRPSFAVADRRSDAPDRSWRLPRGLGLLPGCAIAAGLRDAARRPAVARTTEPLRVAAAPPTSSRSCRGWPSGSGRRTGTATTLTLRCLGPARRADQGGAPFDVFLSANVRSSSDLAAGGSSCPARSGPTPGARSCSAVHAAVGRPGRGLADLGRPEVKKIAIANPEYAPYGVAAKQALEQAGLWSSSRAEDRAGRSVRQALHYVQTGDAEAALVGRALADVPEVRVDRGRSRALRPARPGAGDRRGQRPAPTTPRVRPVRARRGGAGDPARVRLRAAVIRPGSRRPAARYDGQVAESSIMADLAPLWLSLRVAAAATALIVAAGAARGTVLARVQVPGQGAAGGPAGLAAGPAADGAGLSPAPGPGPPDLARAAGSSRRWGSSLVFHWSGAVRGVGGRGVPALPAAGAGGVRGGRPGARGRGPAARPARALGLPGPSPCPLAWRGLAAGAVLAFARALGDFGATMMVAGNIPGLTQTASLAIYDAVQAGDPAARRPG